MIKYYYNTHLKPHKEYNKCNTRVVKKQTFSFFSLLLLLFLLIIFTVWGGAIRWRGAGRVLWIILKRSHFHLQIVKFLCHESSLNKKGIMWYTAQSIGGEETLSADIYRYIQHFHGSLYLFLLLLLFLLLILFIIVTVWTWTRLLYTQKYIFLNHCGFCSLHCNITVLCCKYCISTHWW